MSRSSLNEKSGTSGTPSAPVVMHLPDASSTLENAVVKALEYCADKMHLGRWEAALEYVRHGDQTARSYTAYSLALQVGEALGGLDDNVKAVLTYDYDATPDDVALGGGSLFSPVHLIVWTERKTSALTSLIGAMDRNLAEQYGKLTGPRQMAHLLDAQLIDNSDVENRLGYGALLTSLYNRPLRVWER